jgi:hypothetical protein
MPDDSTRTVLVALLAGLGVTLAKVGAAVVTGSTALAAEAAHSLADNANDLAPGPRCCWLEPQNSFGALGPVSGLGAHPAAPAS